MVDYKALYFKLFGATEDAIEKLIQTQQECEELYLQQSEHGAEDEKEKGHIL